MIIALDLANDDPRSIGDNWSMHEIPFDFSHLWAVWDDENLYIAWQYVDVTDIIDPANAGSSAGTKPNQIDLIQWIAFDTKQEAGASIDMWGKNELEPYWNGHDLPDYQIYVASNLFQGFIAEAVDNEFLVPEDTSITETDHYHKFVEGYPSEQIGDTGIEVAVSNTFGGTTLWGVQDADKALESPIEQTDISDFISQGHDINRDTFYEIKIPFSAIGITKGYLESSGIGIMLGQGEVSCLDTIPNDPATSDTVGVSDSNSPLEWGDIDLLSVPFARIGSFK